MDSNNTTAFASSNGTSSRTFFQTYHVNFFAYVAVGSLISILAVASNVVCLVAICTYPALRRRGNVLVANLVVLNILLSLTVHPISFMSILIREYGSLPVRLC